ncbi:MAG: phosphoribosylglycinamide formyltransferase [Chloroflexaceae bacterium]|nr:phosphoribosylglycinamide formyltransferase [Chloroflexaceae bacterium]
MGSHQHLWILPLSFHRLSPPPDFTTAPLILGILASGQGSNFAAIATAIATGQLNAQIAVAIYNRPEAQIKQKAEACQVPAVFIDHRAYDTRPACDRAIVEVLQRYRVELVVMAGWMRIVTPVLLETFPHRILNIHPSLLPSFRGLKAIEQALEAGVKISGCTVHLVSEAVDSGPILLQAAVPVLPDDTPATLHARIQEQEHHLLPQGITHMMQRLRGKLG